MTSPHQPRRPGWRCAACQDEWPCARRRAELRAEFEGERVRLALHMAGYLGEAALDHPDAAESLLYDRFLGWCRDRRR